MVRGVVKWDISGVAFILSCEGFTVFAEVQNSR